MQGSIIEALAGNVTLTAGAITLAAGVDSFTTYAIHKERFVGLNVSVEAGGNNPLSGVQKGAGYLIGGGQDQGPAGQAPLRGRGRRAGGAGPAQPL